MTDRSDMSYPRTNSALNKSLKEHGFHNAEGLIQDLSNAFSIIEEVPDFLWTDIRFFDICRDICIKSPGPWIIKVIDPVEEYFSKLYGILPVIFSADASSPKEYFDLISRVIGVSTADSIIYLWKECVVVSASGEWMFRFDREVEKGEYYCCSPTLIPSKLRFFIE